MKYYKSRFKFFKRLFEKEPPKEIPPMPPWEEIVEIMYDKNLNSFIDEVVSVIYSIDKTMRYVVLKNERGLYTYHLEIIYQFDEDEWNYICVEKDALPAMWEPYFAGIARRSLFGNEEDLLKEMKEEPEYKQYFE